MESGEGIRRASGWICRWVGLGQVSFVWCIRLSDQLAVLREPWLTVARRNSPRTSYESLISLHLLRYTNGKQLDKCWFPLERDAVLMEFVPHDDKAFIHEIEHTVLRVNEVWPKLFIIWVSYKVSTTLASSKSERIKISADPFRKIPFDNIWISRGKYQLEFWLFQILNLGMMYKLTTEPPFGYIIIINFFHLFFRTVWVKLSQKSNQCKFKVILGFILAGRHRHCQIVNSHNQPWLCVCVCVSVSIPNYHIDLQKILLLVSHVQLYLLAKLFCIFAHNLDERKVWIYGSI